MSRFKLRNESDNNTNKSGEQRVQTTSRETEESSKESGPSEAFCLSKGLKLIALTNGNCQTAVRRRQLNIHSYIT